MDEELKKALAQIAQLQQQVTTLQATIAERDKTIVDEQTKFKALNKQYERDLATAGEKEKELEKIWQAKLEAQKSDHAIERAMSKAGIEDAETLGLLRHLHGMSEVPEGQQRPDFLTWFEGAKANSPVVQRLIPASNPTAVAGAQPGQQPAAQPGQQPGAKPGQAGQPGAAPGQAPGQQPANGGQAGAAPGTGGTHPAQRPGQAGAAGTAPKGGDGTQGGVVPVPTPSQSTFTPEQIRDMPMADFRKILPQLGLGAPAGGEAAPAAK